MKAKEILGWAYDESINMGNVCFVEVPEENNHEWWVNQFGEIPNNGTYLPNGVYMYFYVSQMGASWGEDYMFPDERIELPNTDTMLGVDFVMLFRIEDATSVKELLSVGQRDNIMTCYTAHNPNLVANINKLWRTCNKYDFRRILWAIALRDANEYAEKVSDTLPDTPAEIKLFMTDILERICDDTDLETILAFFHIDY